VVSSVRFAIIVCRAASFFCARVWGGCCAGAVTEPFAMLLLSVLRRYSGALGLLLLAAIGLTAPLRQPVGEMMRIVRGETVPLAIRPPLTAG
jgi:hypothetical protein